MDIYKIDANHTIYYLNPKHPFPYRNTRRGRQGEKRESVCEGAVVFYCDACLGSKPEMVDEHRISRCIRSSDLIEFEREILLGIVDLIEIGCEGQDSYRSF